VRSGAATAILAGDGAAAAAAVRLTYVGAADLELRRERRGRSLAYRDARGRALRDRATLARIRALAIPPAWRDVRIAADPDGHLQATGLDARGRKQYRYHARWRQVRDAAKYHRLVGFCAVLPRLRKAIARDLACACLCKAKVVATIVALMEAGQLRVGNDAYTRANGSYGATTLRDRHATIHGGTLTLSYRGKGGIDRRIRIDDRRLARIVRRCRDLPGQRLFQYVGDDGAVVPVGSSDVNAYIQAATDGPYSAKDFRTWAATIGAARLLAAAARPDGERACKREIADALAIVAARLGHTVAICRGSYVHPAVLDGFADGSLARSLGAAARRRAGDDPLGPATLRRLEGAVARYLAAPRRATARLRAAGRRAIRAA
jgi:DNA topoisomerase-1